MKIKLKFNEEQLVNFIKDLLGGPGKWKALTKKGKLIINLKGEKHKVQKEIFDWLSIPERKHNFDLYHSIKRNHAEKKRR